MTDADLDKLEALAKAATQGPEDHWTGGDWSLWVQFLEFYDYAPASAIALLKAINPAAILDLIASARRDAEEIERLRAALAEQQADTAFLLARAGHAGSCSFAPGRWTGMSSNAIVSVAFGGDQTALPSDVSDYLACVRTFRRLPRHRRTEPVKVALKRARDAYTARCPRRARAAHTREG